MPEVLCPVCTRGFDVNAAEEHIAEAHSDPDARVGDMTEADFIRSKLSSGGDGDLPPPEDGEGAAVQGPLEELGIKEADFKPVIPSVMSGATLTPTEAKAAMVAVEEYVKFRIDRAAFIVDFVDWGLRNSFSEELKEAGGFTIHSHTTVKITETYVRVDNLQTAIEEYFAAKGYGRKFTFRRFGRYLGKTIPVVMDRNPTLSNYFVDGTPMSNRLGVPAADCLAVCSIFEYIKPYRKWSTEEKSAWMAHNRSVVKFAKSQDVAFLPTDLRPSPSQAETLLDVGINDFGRRNGLSPGESIFSKLYDQGQQKGLKTGVGLKSPYSRMAPPADL